MDLQTLRFFVATADAGSFTAAAERLHYAQSNLSNRIKQLENELGEPLFYRYKRGIALTAKGKLFYEYTTRILTLSNEAVTIIRDMEHARGQLALGSLEATALKDLPELLSEYHKTYPEVRLSLQTDMNDAFLNLVLNRKLDGAFVSGPVEHPELEEICLKTEELILVGSRDKPGIEAETILADAPLITFPEGSAFRRRLELLLSTKSYPYIERLTVLNSLGAMIANICAGIGYGYLPKSIVEPYLENGTLVEHPLKHPYSSINVVFIYRKDHIQDAAFRYFLEMIELSHKKIE